MKGTIAFLYICMVAVIVYVGAFAYTLIYDFWPAVTSGGVMGKAAMLALYSNGFGLFDRSFFLVALIGIIVGVVFTYLDPNPLMGMLDIAALFVFGFFFVTFRTVILGLLSDVFFPIIFPNTYAVVSSNWVALVLFVSIGVEAVLNFSSIRAKPTQSNYVSAYENEGED